MTTLAQPLGLTAANGMSNHEAALLYVSFGWFVVPLWWIDDESFDEPGCACGGADCARRGSQGKHPWKGVGLKSSTNTTFMVERWWRQEPRLGVAVDMKRSGLVALDRDGWKGASDATTWGFNLDDAAIQLSGSGNGEHYVWRTSQIGDAIPSSGIDGVDTKYDGYIVVAPTLHKSGKRYSWTSDELPGALPSPLLERLLERKSTRSVETGGDDKIDRDAILRGEWDGEYDTHRNALLGLTASHWAQGKLSRDEIKDLVWLAAQRGNTASEEKYYWKRAEVDTLVDSICDVKPQGLSDDYATADVPVKLDAFLAGFRSAGAEGDPEELSKTLRNAMMREYELRQARRAIDDFEAAEARGERPKRTAAQYELVEQPSVILEGLLAADVNILAGPAQQGKSLWARDLAFEVARQGRNVLMITSESNHDFATRYVTQPGYADVKNSLYILDEPIRVTTESEVQWLLDEYADEKPGLVVFDLITDMGVEKEEKGDDVGRVMRALKRISREWGAATLAIGHPPLNRERRIRGSGAWRDRCLVEWHMADGYLSCEKTKIGPKPANRHYRITYPGITWSDGAPSLTVAFEGAIREQQDQEARIVELVRRLEHASKNGICKMLGGNRGNLLADIDLLIAAGKLVEERPGRLVAAPE